MAGGSRQSKDGARHRALASKAGQLTAPAVHPRARSGHRRARAVHPHARPGHRRVQLLSGPSWNSLELPFSSNITEGGGRICTRSSNRHTLNADLTKAWPYDGKYGATSGDGPSGTRLRENINSVVAGVQEEECTAAFSNANSSDPLACRSVRLSAVISIVDATD